MRLLRAALDGAGLADRATVVPFDLTRPELWPEYVPLGARHFVRAFSAWEKDKAGRLADGGYAVTVVDGDPATKLDAAAIRDRLRRRDVGGDGAPGDGAGAAGAPGGLRP